MASKKQKLSVPVENPNNILDGSATAFSEPESLDRDSSSAKSIGYYRRTIKSLKKVAAETVEPIVESEYTNLELVPLNPMQILLEEELCHCQHLEQLIPLGQFGLHPSVQDHPQYISLKYDTSITSGLCIWLQIDIQTPGEAIQHYRNDGLLYAVVHLATDGLGVGSRDTAQACTIGGVLRPVFTALWNNVPLFLVEEKAHHNICGAVADILRKFRWLPEHRKLPFFLGFAFSHHEAGIVVIHKNGKNTTLISPITLIGERFLFMEKALFAARMLKYFVDNNLIG